MLAALAGQDLLALRGDGSLVPLFHFAVSANVQRIVVARSAVPDHEHCSGHAASFIGAMAIGSPDGRAVDVELVLMRGDGALLAHHRETVPVDNSAVAAAIAGNAGGAFAFGVGREPVGKVWLALPSGDLLGADGVLLADPGVGLVGSPVEPDARGRLLVQGATPKDGGLGYAWLDVCAGTRTPALLANTGNATGWGSEVLGFDASGQIAVETADGVTPLAHPPFGAGARLFGLDRTVLLIAVPPFSNGLTGNFVTVDAAALADHTLSLAYGGLSPVGGISLSGIGTSSNPAGFGVDSAGRVTMFLRDGSGAIHLEATAHGSDWSVIGTPVSYDPIFEPSYSLDFAEAAGTFIIQGRNAIGAPSWQLARPATGLAIPLAGPGRIAYDGSCAAVLAAPDRLDVIDARTGRITPVALPSPVMADAFTSSWIPGDDAVGPGAY